MKKTLIFALIISGFHAAAQTQAYYHTPAIYDHWIVFTAEGDLWKQDLNTGISSRLTSHHGIESEPLFTTDGKSIVFTGQYEGPTELYMIPSGGGIPRRLTFEHTYGIAAHGWTQDGKLIYNTGAYSRLRDDQLAKLNTEDLSQELIPLAQAADGTYTNDNVLFFTRVPHQGSQTKRYKGGTAQSIWKFAGAAASICVTCDYTGTSKQAMVYKDRIYFSSDRDGTMNIWSMDKDGKDLRQHTFSSGWDIQSPSIGDSKIVYQKGADIWVYDINLNEDKLITINLNSDFDQRRPRWIRNAAELISDWETSPSGKYVALIARGRIFVSPASGGRWVEVTRKSGIRYRDVHFLDDNTVIYTSDESGEVEIWRAPANGSGTPLQLTKDSKVLITGILASPDGKWIAWRDKNLKLNVFSIATMSSRLVEANEYSEIYNMSWSNDSNYLFYASSGANTAESLKAFDVASGKIDRITTDRLDSHNASLSSDKKWLYFTSDREFKTKVDGPWGSRQPEPYYDKVTKIYALALTAADHFPFVQNDTWKDDKAKDDDKKNNPEEKDSKKKDKDKKDSAPRIVVDWKAAAQRLYEVPLEGRNITNFKLAENHLYWTEIEAGHWDASKLYALKIEFNKKIEPTLVAEGISGFDISGDMKKITVFKSNALYVSDANGEKMDLEKTKVDLSNWTFQLNPTDDWKQMFSDAWRMERDYFYDTKLHGVDWTGVKKRYEPLLARVADRHDLDDLLAQMISELSALHMFVYGGDKRQAPDNIQIGSLGADLVKDAASGGYRITHIYKGDPDYPAQQSPLNQPNLKIKEGDILIKIDDSPLSGYHHYNELLANKVGDIVKLTLKDAGGVVYEELVKPLSGSENYNVRYNEWEYSRRQEVDQKSNDQIGYVHLRAMGSNDINDFVKNFYPVFNRSGLILDVRHNGGGNIDSWILEKLMRKAWFYWQPRVGKATWNMQYAFRGHIVVLCDEGTGSDGEAVTEGIRRLNLGTIIGTRTWGGEIWLTSSNRLVDNGVATAAEFGVFDATGKWLIEGHGVDPDVVVDNEPYETFQGKDRQLEAAIKFLQDKIVKEPVAEPKAPAYPDKSFKYK